MAKEVIIEFRAELNQIKSQLKQLQGDLGQVDGKAKQAEKGIGSIDAASNKLRTTMMGLAKQVAAAFAVQQIVQFAKQTVAAASDLNETISKTNVIFGNATQSVLEWSKNSAAAFGQSQQQALDAAANFAIFGKSAGLAGEDLVKFSTDFTELASDLASFNNTSPEEAITAIGAALRGEAEPIRRYGVLLNEATLKQEALALGIINTTKEALTPQQRVLAAQAAIYKQTSDAQGDFQRTSEGLANSQRILAANMENLAARLGGALIPMAEKATSALIGLLEGIERLIVGTEETYTFQERLAMVTDQLAESVATERIEVDLLFDRLKAVNTVGVGRANVIKEINEQYGKYLPQLLNEKSTLEDIETAYKAVTSAMTQQIIMQALSKEIEALTKAMVEAQAELNSYGAGIQDVTLFGETFTRETQASTVVQSGYQQMIDETKKRFEELAESLGVVLGDLDLFNEENKKGEESSTALGTGADYAAGSIKSLQEMLKAMQTQLLSMKFGTEEFQALSVSIAEAEEKLRDLMLMQLIYSEGVKTTAQTTKEYSDETLQNAEMTKQGIQVIGEEYDKFGNVVDDTAEKVGGRLDTEVEKQKQRTEEWQRQNEADAQAFVEASQLTSSEFLYGMAAIQQGLGEVYASFIKDEATRAQFQKSMALFNIGLSTAAAIASTIEKASAIPPPGNIAAIATGIGVVLSNIARATNLINQQNSPTPPQFAKGGFVGGKSHADGGTLIEAEAGEFIINKRDARANKDILKAINTGNLSKYVVKHYVEPLTRSMAQERNSLADNIAASLAEQMNSQNGYLRKMSRGVNVNNLDKLAKIMRQPNVNKMRH